jgi:hypothetical protein
MGTVGTDFKRSVEPILSHYCYDCHGDGESKGNVALDQFKSDESLTTKPELWWAVLKNVRSGIMPPAKKPRPGPEEKLVLENWIKRDAFGIDPNDPDPGRAAPAGFIEVESASAVGQYGPGGRPADG